MCSPRSSSNTCLRTKSLWIHDPWKLSSADLYLATYRDWVWVAFARPVPELPDSPNTRVPSGKLSALESLPKELVHIIIDQLFPVKNDVIAFGKTSPVLWPLVLYRVRSEYLKQAAPWAGKKIACLRTDTKPFSMHYEAEPDTRPRRTQKLQHGKLFPGTSFRTDVFDWPPPPIEDEERYWKWEAQPIKPVTPESEPKLCRDLSVRKLFPNDRTWLLRNHTTKQFVSSTALDRDRGASTNERPGFSGTYSFHHVLMSRICWSDTPVGNETYEGLSFHHGRWAEHRFDIVTLDYHDAETKGEEWTDCSDEVVQDLENIDKILSLNGVVKHQVPRD